MIPPAYPKKAWKAILISWSLTFHGRGIHSKLQIGISDKTIIPFFTHNGSSSGASSISTVEKLCPDSTVLTDDYFTYLGDNVGKAESNVNEWLTELGYKK
ncbi:MAG: hypothetical protein HFI37_09630 [Lachnospiraceae bacterium]|nr:hypothetical protein [Lachnospiraceae bacterium]